MKEMRVDNWQINVGQGGEMQASRHREITCVRQCVSLERAAWRSGESSPVLTRSLRMCWRSQSPNRSLLLSISTWGFQSGSESREIYGGKGALGGRVGECVGACCWNILAWVQCFVLQQMLARCGGLCFFPLGSLVQASGVVFHGQN